MYQHAGAGEADGAHAARVAANKALDDAAIELNPAAMREAIRAGADVHALGSGSEHFIIPRAAGGVIHGAPFPHDGDDVIDDDAERDTIRAAALRVLVEHGCFTSSRMADVTLHEAVYYSCGPVVVSCLLDAGASPLVRGAGDSPLLCINHRLDTARVLIAAGADVNAVDQRGNSPLHCLDGFPRTDAGMVGLLVGAGAAVDVRNEEGVTPLMMAAAPDQCTAEALATAADLLSAGADPTATNNAGGTALDEAMRIAAMPFVRYSSTAPGYNGGVKKRLAMVRLLARAQAWWRCRHVVAAWAAANPTV